MQTRTLLGTIVVSALLSLCSAHFVKSDGAVALVGSSVQGSLGGGAEELKLLPRDVGALLRRLGCAEVGGSGGLEEIPLPTCDIFSQPESMLTLVIDGVGLEDVQKLGGTSTLKKLFSEGSAQSTALRLPNALLFGSSNARSKLLFDVCTAGSKKMDVQLQLALSDEALARELVNMVGGKLRSWDDVARTGPACVSAEPEEPLVNYAIGHETPDQEKDFALFHSILNRNCSDKVKQRYVFGTSVDAGGASGRLPLLVSLDSRVEELVSAFTRQYGDKSVILIALLGSNLPSEFAKSYRALSNVNSDAKGFEGWDFVLMLWASLSLSVVLLLLLCCVPWSSELDPLLLSSIKANDHLKEN